MQSNQVASDVLQFYKHKHAIVSACTNGQNLPDIILSVRNLCKAFRFHLKGYLCFALLCAIDSTTGQDLILMI